MRLLGLALPVPDHTTLSRRAAALEVPWPRSGSNADAGREAAPVHLLVDSTGLKLCGPGEWRIEKHGTRPRRSWRALPPGGDAAPGEIAAATLPPPDVDDGSQAGPLARPSGRTCGLLHGRWRVRSGSRVRQRRRAPPRGDHHRAAARDRRAEPDG